MIKTWKPSQATSADGRPQVRRMGEEVQARLLQAVAAVLLGQRQGGLHRAGVDALAQLVGAHHLQPLRTEPVRRREQTRVHLGCVWFSACNEA